MVIYSSSYIFTFMGNRKGCDNTLSGWILTIYLCGSVIGGLIGGALNDKIGYKK